MGEDEHAERFRRALAVAEGMVEGRRVVIEADDAEALHDPLVASALLGRAERDPGLAGKVGGGLGRWLRDAGAEPLPEGVALSLYVSRALSGAAQGEGAGQVAVASLSA